MDLNDLLVAAEDAGVKIDAVIAHKLLQMADLWDVEDSLRRVRQIEHDLNPACSCGTCSEVVRIAETYR